MADFCNSCVDSWQGGPDGGHGMRPRGRANPRSAAFGNSHDMTPASFVVDGPWCAEQRGMSRVTGYVVGVGADTLAGQCVPVPASGLCLGRCFSGLKAERRLQASAPRENKVSNAGPMPSRLHMLAGLGRDARCEMRYGYATCNMLHATCAPPVRASLAVEVASRPQRQPAKPPAPPRPTRQSPPPPHRLEADVRHPQPPCSMAPAATLEHAISAQHPCASCPAVL
jgi:hypothetical protein